MVAPDEFRRLVLQGLYYDARKGRGTDLEVIVPNNDDEGNRDNSDNNDGKAAAATTSFHLHHTIAATSSRYFATFPEPKVGRVINDVDSETFSICVKFLYMGEHGGYREAFTHENIASILHAAELLQIDGLKENCIEYLKQNLDHSNYEQIVELADRFNNPDLKKSALRFQCKNTARDELLSKREALVKKIGILVYNENQISDSRRGLQTKLRDMEVQIQDIFQTQHEQMLSSKWENGMAGEAMSATSIPFSLGTFRKPGAVGHLVHSSYGRDWPYEGSSTYGDEVDSSDVDDDSPPPPTEEEYESFGIVNSHCSIMTAIEAATPGDRIYLEQGIHSVSENPCYIDKALEFIGLDEDEVTVEVHGDKHCFLVTGGSVGFYNIKFHDKRLEDGNDRSSDKPNTSQGSGDEAVICLEASMKDDFIVKNCVFDLGTDCDTANPTRVSGIFLKRGKSATIEACNKKFFLGGAGSAIVAVNDPYQYIPNIEISHNRFVNNGQPTFSEKSANEVFSSRSKKLEFIPIPTHEITPGPASVELWKFDRECYKTSKYGKEKHETVTIKMTENKFASNLRAPLAFRQIVPKSDWTKRTNDWQLHHDLPAGDGGINASLQEFDLALKDNALENNGLQFDKETISRMKCTLDVKEKKIRTEGNGQSKSCKFPDGDSLLVIKHCISQFDENSFPPGWGDGEPFENYAHEYTQHDQDSYGSGYGSGPDVGDY
mmetsp:Transcript_21536/g.46834  ORF Transcript_21536/g.46834 Transcript_21536/m.46834 type:complete len:718 (+) Transcript_21536:66-2219(+)